MNLKFSLSLIMAISVLGACAKKGAVTAPRESNESVVTEKTPEVVDDIEDTTSDSSWLDAEREKFEEAYGQDAEASRVAYVQYLKSEISHLSTLISKTKRSVSEMELMLVRVKQGLRPEAFSFKTLAWIGAGSAAGGTLISLLSRDGLRGVTVSGLTLLAIAGSTHILAYFNFNRHMNAKQQDELAEKIEIQKRVLAVSQTILEQRTVYLSALTSVQ